MKVRELIETLKKCDLDADVYTDFESGMTVEAVVSVHSDMVAGVTYKDLPSYVELD